MFSDMDEFAPGVEASGSDLMVFGPLRHVSPVDYATFLRCTGGGGRAHVLGERIGNWELVRLREDHFRSFRTIVSDERDLGLEIVSDDGDGDLFLSDVVTHAF
jgi:hypothetical protein